MFSRRVLFALILLLLMSLPSGAQIDPEGLALSQQLEARFQADDKEGFLELFNQDTALSRRAFLAAMEVGLKALHEEKEAEGERYFIIATVLSVALQRQMQDSTPDKILKTFQDRDNKAIILFLDYADQYYPGYREALQSEVAWLGADAVTPPPKDQDRGPSDSDYLKTPIDPASVSPEYFEIIRPLLVKLQRVDFAGMFDDKNLVLQELVTFPDVEAQARVSADEAGLGERFQNDFAYLKPEMELAEMRLLAETGLLDEFDANIPAVLNGPGTTAAKLSLLYTAYRVTLRTQSLDRAETYLSQMSDLMGQNEPSPIFKFLYATGVFQVELARGKQCTPVQLQKRFFSTWDILGDYRAGTRVQEDVHFHLVREAARFWLNQLTTLVPSQNVQAILRINEDCAAWLDQTGSLGDSIGDLNNDEILFYSPQMQGYLTVVLSGLDIIMYIIETWKPMLEDRENFAGVVEPFPQRIEDIAGSASEMTPEMETGPAFPQIDLGQAFLLAELRARSRYLLAIDPANTPEEKLAYLREASGLVDKLDQPESFIDYQLLLGKSFSEVGQSEEAIQAWSKARKLAEERGFVRRALEATLYLSQEWGRLDQWDKAGALAAVASKTLEEELDSSSGLAEISRSLAEIRTRAAVETDDPEAALTALNQNQQVQAASLRLRGQSEGAQATRGLNAKKKKLALLSRKVQDLQSRPSSGTRDELLEKTEKLLAESRSDFLLESRKIRKKFSKLYSTALRFDPLNLPDIQSVLPPRTAVVQYFPTEEELYIFVVSGDEFRLRSVVQKKAALDQQVLDFLGQLREVRPRDAELATLSQGLYNALIRPIESDIQDADTLVLIPAGNLNILPFASLQSSPDRYLLDSKTLLELAKPTDFLKIATSGSRPIGKIVVLANATEDLPAAEQEGQSIKEMFPNSELFTRTNANKDNLMKSGQDADVLHLATHGVWDAQNSLNNHLRLANDEKLAQEEIFEMSLETSIVTLSACSTALGDHKDVEYVASLAEAFWIAGSRSVIASLWQVDDASTGLLMTTFYQELKAGKPKGVALRNAQMKVKQNKLYSHPYYWSGFMLFGDYR